MKVKITRTDWGLSEKLTEAYPVLLDYPTFEEHKSRCEYFGYIELNTTEDLFVLIEKLGHELVLMVNSPEELEIEIYDGYRE